MTRSSTLFYSEFDTLIGPLTIVLSRKGICRIDFGTGDLVLRNVERWCRKHLLTDQLLRDDLALVDIKTQLTEYFMGQRTSFDYELDIHGTPFQKLVWNVLLQIPYGSMASYKEVAQEIGSPKAVRAVGGANNRNPIPIIIPCHRVVGSNGALVGYGGGLSIKEKLLEVEGLNQAKRLKA